MALVVDSNTYISLADADIYFNTRFGSEAWIALNDTVKEQLLISATRALDLYCDWSGYPNDDDQLLSFPRDFKEVPSKVIIAQCEIAFSILENESVIDANNPNLKKMKADVVELVFGDMSSTENTLYNDFVTRLLNGFCSNGSAGSKKLTRV